MKLGAHMSTGGGVWKALERGKGINCETIQIFVKNNMQWFGRPHTPRELAQYASEFNTCGFACVFGHGCNSRFGFVVARTQSYLPERGADFERTVISKGSR